MMINIRDKCTEWSTKTFSTALNELNITDKALLNQTKLCFQALNILDKNINGYASEGLPKTEEGNLGLKFTYSEVFHNLIDDNNFTPVTYLVTIISKFLDSSATIEKINGAVARGLRTLTSLLREPDFAYQIENKLRNYGFTVSTELNSRQDGGDHTDVLLLIDKKVYRIWLFQFSARGLPHDIERVSGKRGELPDGIHLLCPLHTEVALNYDSTRKKIEKLNIKIEKYQSDLVTCSTRAIKKRKNLEEKLKNSVESITVLNLLAKDEFEVCTKELDIVEGWFFYSNDHIDRISKFIINNPTIDDYSDVVQTLTSPERYLSEIQIFEK